MSPAQHATCSFYLSGCLALVLASLVRVEPAAHVVRPLDRGLSRGEIGPGLPRLDPDDPMANAAVIKVALEGVAGADCPPRLVKVLLDGQLSKVRMPGRLVCQLRRLKEISAVQPGFGEVAAFILGRRDGWDVEVSRVVVPPFRYSGQTVRFYAADLGPLGPRERMIGTYHTHPAGDLEEGLLSLTDLRFMHTGWVDFHGQVGDLSAPGPDLDWLFDIVEPRHGDWNIFAHDRLRLAELFTTCRAGPICPVEDLRLSGSRHYLLTRYYEDR